MAHPASATRAREPAFDAPSRQCDVVMKGGITSGIACPLVVLELAHTYRFRSIGGTSAGAIAAAVTAAAEYGRERGGFEKLKALNEWLAEGTHQRDLFQPTRATRPLLTLLFALERRGRQEPVGSGAAGIVTRFWSWLPGWVRVAFVVIPGALRDALPLRFWIATVLGAIVGGALDVLLARGLVDPGHPLARTVVALVLPVMFIGSYVASVGACVGRLWRLVSVDVPEQGFGICTGLTSAASSETPALTDWLHQRIQDLAGLPVTGPPLTVGMLSTKRVAGSDRGIELRMIATSLSLRQSFVLPIEDQHFLFREDDMRRLFPGSVVDHLVATARRTDAARAVPTGHLALPRPEDMPLLVLARMSMSFPILLSAVPLYVVKTGGSKREEHEPKRASAPAATPDSDRSKTQRVWFSDGGLTSQVPAELSLRSGAVFAPAIQGRTDRAISEIASLPEFLAAIWRTTQNSHDNMLVALPGNGESIVQIGPASEEHGLDLAIGHHIMHKDDAADGS